MSSFQLSPTTIPALLIGIFHPKAVCEVRLSKLWKLTGLAFVTKTLKETIACFSPNVRKRFNYFCKNYGQLVVCIVDLI